MGHMIRSDVGGQKEHTYWNFELFNRVPLAHVHDLDEASLLLLAKEFVFQLEHGLNEHFLHICLELGGNLPLPADWNLKILANFYHDDVDTFNQIKITHLEPAAAQNRGHWVNVNKDNLLSVQFQAFLMFRFGRSQTQTVNRLLSDPKMFTRFYIDAPIFAMPPLSETTVNSIHSSHEEHPRFVRSFIWYAMVLGNYDQIKSIFDYCGLITYKYRGLTMLSCLDELAVRDDLDLATFLKCLMNNIPPDVHKMVVYYFSIRKEPWFRGYQYSRVICPEIMTQYSPQAHPKLTMTLLLAITHPDSHNEVMQRPFCRKNIAFFESAKRDADALNYALESASVLYRPDGAPSVTIEVPEQGFQQATTILARGQNTQEEQE